MVGFGSCLVSCRTASSGRAAPQIASLAGHRIYEEHCAACHGSTGRGDGPASIALKIRPRDFWNEPLRYISGPDGVSTEEDLLHSIRSGRRIGEMPANPQLTDAEVVALADFVREMNRQGWVERLTRAVEEDEEMDPDEIEEIADERVLPGDPIPISSPGLKFRSDTQVGHKLYMESCASCHGPTGRGDGLDKPLDERGRSIQVRDLTSGEYRGGVTLEEVFKRIRCGIPGTPMPASDTMSDQDVWQLVYYVQFLARGRR